MFWVKKIISQLIMPVPLIIFLLLLAVIFRKKTRFSMCLTITAIVILLMLSSSVVSNWLAEQLEQQYAVNNTQPIQPCIVMVLGSGHDDHLQASVLQQLSPTANMRLNEALRQWQMGSDCLLVTSGWAGNVNQGSNAELMADAAIERGVPTTNIVMFPLAKDTIEEAQYLKKAIGQKPFRLVTSASHMPRSMAIFQQAGLTPQAAPADFYNRRGNWWQLSAHNLVTSQAAIHEYVGRLWFYIKSQYLPL